MDFNKKPGPKEKTTVAWKGTLKDSRRPIIKILHINKITNVMIVKESIFEKIINVSSEN